jgi:HEAT repeat protein
LLTGWLADPSPRLRQTALLALPALGNGSTLQLVEQAAKDSDPEVRHALVETLNALARQGMTEAVLASLTGWAAAPQPNHWVITRTLSASWAAAHPQAALAILETLAHTAAPERGLNRTLHALTRHGAGEAVRATLQDWAAAPDPALQALAQGFLAETQNGED